MLYNQRLARLYFWGRQIKKQRGTSTPLAKMTKVTGFITFMLQASLFLVPFIT